MQRRRKRRRRRISTFIKGKYLGKRGGSTPLLPYKHPPLACLPTSTPPPLHLPLHRTFSPTDNRGKEHGATLGSPCLALVPTLPQPGESRGRRGTRSPGAAASPRSLRAAPRGSALPTPPAQPAPRRGTAIRAGQPTRRLPPCSSVHCTSVLLTHPRGIEIS